VCDLEAIGALSMFRLIREATTLSRMLLTLDLSCEENVFATYFAIIQMRIRIIAK